MLEISILPSNFSKLGIFRSKFRIFGRKFSDKKKIFRQAKKGGLPPAMMPLRQGAEVTADGSSFNRDWKCPFSDCSKTKRVA